LPAAHYRFRSRVCVHERRVDCVLTGWEGWTSCSKSCGGGVTSNAPIVSVHAAGGGSPCPRPRSQICNPARCAHVGSARIEARSALLQRGAGSSSPSHAAHAGLGDSTRSYRAVAAGTGALVGAEHQRGVAAFVHAARSDRARAGRHGHSHALRESDASLPFASTALCNHRGLAASGDTVLDEE